MPHLRFSRWRLVAAVFTVLLAVAACGGGGGSNAGGSNAGGGNAGGGDTAATKAGDSAGASGEIVVFAASSLTEAFTEIGKVFEKRNPAATVTFNFAGSTTLATQLINGAPADVYASANTEQMQRVVEAGLIDGQPIIFVSNTLQIVVPKGNPANVQGLKAFSKEKLDIVVCAPEVPCGDLAKQVFNMVGIQAAVDSYAQNVKQVLTKVALGEADAGLVYRTDVASASRPVVGISFPVASKVANDYAIGVLKDAPNKAGAQAFVDFVLSPKGQKILKSYGFTPQAK